MTRPRSSAHPFTISLLVGLVLGATALGACGEDDEVFSSSDYFDVPAYGEAACDGNDGRLAGTRELRLFANGAQNMRDTTRGLQRYYRRHGLSFFAQQRETQLALPYALDTNLTAISIALRKMFPGVDLDDEAALMRDPEQYNRILTAAVNLIFKPVIDFARTHGNVGQDATNLVVLPQLVRPGGETIAPEGGTLAGLAISGALIEEFGKTMVAEAEVWRGVDLPKGFTPMVFLDGSVLTRAAKRAPVLRDLVAAHEFGHTGALVHVDDPRNLMHPTVDPAINSCRDTLSDAQIARMKVALGLAPAAAQALRVEGEALGPSGAATSAIPARPLLAPGAFTRMLAGDGEPLRALIDRLLPTHD